MVHTFYHIGIVLVLFACLGRPDVAQASEPVTDPWPIEIVPQRAALAPLDKNHHANANAAVNHTFSFDLLPQAVNIKSFYLEKREQPTDTLQWRRHFSLLGRFFYFGDRMVSEGELAYSSLAAVETPCTCNELPQMMRLSLRDKWAEFQYGMNYRLLGRGFVAVTGERVDHDRDESQFWAQRNLGPFKLRGSVGESRERLAHTGPSRLLKTATTTVTMGKPQWSAGFISTFSLVEHDTAVKQEMTVFTHALTGSYQPVNGLSVGSNLSFSEELNHVTGIRTETPKAGINLAYSPSQDWPKMVSSASYGLTYSINGPTHTSTMDASTGLEWRFGSSKAERTLSLNLHYNRQLDFALRNNSRHDFSATIQLTVLGF